MSENPRDWGKIISNLMQIAVVAVAVVVGCFALFGLASGFRYVVIKLLLVGVPVAIAAAAGIGRKK